MSYYASLGSEVQISIFAFLISFATWDNEALRKPKPS
jgi:hypothetical protein